eukprot:3396219-Pleurochrysis_carterae.AAC.1
MRSRAFELRLRSRAFRLQPNNRAPSLQEPINTRCGLAGASTRSRLRVRTRRLLSSFKRALHSFCTVLWGGSACGGRR